MKQNVTGLQLPQPKTVCQQLVVDSEFFFHLIVFPFARQ
jgi:hypothetical protein